MRGRLRGDNEEENEAGNEVGGVAVHARIGVHACTCAPNMEHPQNVNVFIVPNWSIYQSGTLISLRFEDVALHDSCHAHVRVFFFFISKMHRATSSGCRSR